MQPLKLKKHEHLFLVFNGEIYNYKLLRDQFGFEFETNCDTEIIIHLYAYGGIEFCVKHLHGVFAFILADVRNNKVFYARDTFGVRPLFTLDQLPNSSTPGYSVVASEVKALMTAYKNCPRGTARVNIHPPAHFSDYDLCPRSGNITFVRRERFHEIWEKPVYSVNEFPAGSGTLEKNAVDVRMMADCKLGCLLSGGLDSSLICALVKKQMSKWGCNYPLETFAIGLDKNSSDLCAAQKVADHIGSTHHAIVKTKEEFLSCLDQLIYQIETYDVTTIRSSVVMHFLCQYIKQNSQCKILFSGEGSDEVTQGYIYFFNAPSDREAYEESIRLLNDLYLFDVLRADRTTAAHGLELRVPFLDHYFVHTYLQLPNEEKKPINNMEKYTLRKAFDNLNLIPDEILWRRKEACSDGVSPQERSWFSILKEHLENQISDAEFSIASDLYPYNTPKTKEAFYYRKKFEEFYPDQSHLTPYHWMPKWCGEQTDPSARTLSHYHNA
ncbi:asparagine synthetase [glutamine-hydrolyzing]-like isoform X2 [Convolutriloba macropyga]|uniref:asparagine synthetase [glutamine-hydrolyzing]-like isoform X2 n=1 Tax=Convolutriloba macropyga TaxID=536237 RepID=UPI003F5269E0